MKPEYNHVMAVEAHNLEISIISTYINTLTARYEILRIGNCGVNENAFGQCVNSCKQLMPNLYYFNTVLNLLTCKKQQCITTSKILTSELKAHTELC